MSTIIISCYARHVKYPTYIFTYLDRALLWLHESAVLKYGHCLKLFSIAYMAATKLTERM